MSVGDPLAASLAALVASVEALAAVWPDPLQGAAAAVAAGTAVGTAGTAGPVGPAAESAEGSGVGAPAEFSDVEGGVAAGFVPSPVMVDVERMSDAGLLQATRAVFGVLAQAQVLLVRVAGEISGRSRRSLGVEGIAKKAGHPSAPSLLAELGLIPVGEAQRWCRVGEATAVRRSLLGVAGEPAFPVLARAVDAGRVGVVSAGVILSHLGQASPRALRVDMVAAELELTGFAQHHLPEVVRKLAISWRDALDVDGVAPREEELIARRSLVWKKLANGMERCTLTLDPLGAGFLHAVISARVGDLLRGVHFTDDPIPPAPCAVHANRNPLIDCGCPRPGAGQDGAAADSGSGAGALAGEGSGCGLGKLEDLRTIPQLSYDGFIDVLEHVLTCTAGPGTLPHTTLIVRMDLDALTSGLGAAQIDGVEEPITAHTARVLAAEANIIPQVLGGDSAVLDQGVGRRLFTRAQRLALLERDDGCAVTDCLHPASHTEAHHIDWWVRDNGPTDLRNGILLCTSHHHVVHRQGWEIRVVDNVPWFIPPATVDPARTPRRGGRMPVPVLPSVTARQQEHAA